MADPARRAGEREAREQAARENQELRNQLEAARLEAERVNSEALRALRDQEQKTQTNRDEDHKRMADACLKGRAREQMRNNVLAARTMSEENRGLRSDLGRRRIEKEIESTLAQPSHVGPPPRPIAARPIGAPGASRVQMRLGSPNQACRICTQLSTD
eukprot:1102515-Pyramimonas_sp.AAC.1